MARIEEATLFRPDPKLQYPGQAPGRGPQGGGGGGGRGGGGEEDDGPTIGVRERVAEAARSARRRKGLSFVVVMICGALTVLGAIFAPRNYEVESRILVQRTQNLNGGAQAQYVSPEEMRNQANEYQEQMMAKDNIIAIVRQKDLVTRWDDMRQPHRRLIDKINRKLGKPGPTDDEKFEALVGNIEHRMKVWVDGSTITVRLEWSEPEAARDIVDAAVKNFLDARFQSEVGVIPDKLKILEAGVAQAHKELEVSANDLGRLKKLKDPNNKLNIVVPQLPQGVGDRPKFDETAAVDPQLRARLENVRGQINVLQEAKLRREAELNQELIQKRQTLAEGHPDIIALKQTIEATKADPPQLTALKQQEREIVGQINAQQRDAAAAAKAAEPKATAKPAVAPMPVPTAKPDDMGSQGATTEQNAQVLFDAVSKKYNDIVAQLDAARLELKMAEGSFKNRYRVVHPAEIPAGPKRPVALIAIAIGILMTIASVLLVASLADRFSGIFFEPRDVRDRLGLPVFATFS